jgi:hypothetical protein
MERVVEALKNLDPLEQFAEIVLKGSSSVKASTFYPRRISVQSVNEDLAWADLLAARRPL